MKKTIGFLVTIIVLVGGFFLSKYIYEKYSEAKSQKEWQEQKRIDEENIKKAKDIRYENYKTVDEIYDRFLIARER